VDRLPWQEPRLRRPQRRQPLSRWCPDMARRLSGDQIIACQKDRMTPAGSCRPGGATAGVSGETPHAIAPGAETRREHPRRGRGQACGAPAEKMRSRQLGYECECGLMELSDAAAAWRRDGFVVLPGYLDGPALEAAQRDLATVYPRPASPLPRPEHKAVAPKPTSCPEWLIRTLGDPAATAPGRPFRGVRPDLPTG
jgi:hypothetical protein